ncbi:MAG: helix-turn-helix domain-containing protein [Candidatus Marsarchaeota archaeon]|nr:helix-turn-helix domain-containing protein [Candidatus Marsarchaeota archaeon]
MILTLVRRTPKNEGDGLESFCRSMRILSARDMDGTVTVVFRSMLTEGRQPVGSSELAQLTRLNRVTIIHHLQRLEQMGLVEHTERKYRLRVHDLSEAVEQMREEMMRSFEEAEVMALELDRQFMLGIGEEADNRQKSLMLEPAGPPPLKRPRKRLI